MGVYQSATEPETRRKGFRHRLDRRFGVSEEQWLEDIKPLLRKHKVPVRVKPTRREDEFGIVYSWDWFEVETFN